MSTRSRAILTGRDLVEADLRSDEPDRLQETSDAERVGDPEDIAAMKLSAVAGRGSRKDFVDLYVCCGRECPGSVAYRRPP